MLKKNTLDYNFELKFRVCGGYSLKDREWWQFFLFPQKKGCDQYKEISKILKNGGVEFPKVPLFHSNNHSLSSESTLKTPFTMQIPAIAFSAIPEIIKKDIIKKGGEKKSVEIFISSQNINSLNNSPGFYPHYATDPSFGDKSYYVKRQIRGGIFFPDTQNVFFKGRNLNEFVEGWISIQSKEPIYLDAYNQRNVALTSSDLNIDGIFNISQSLWSYVNYYDEVSQEQKFIVTLHWLFNDFQQIVLLKNLEKIPLASEINVSRIYSFFMGMAAHPAFKGVGGHFLKGLKLLEALQSFPGQAPKKENKSPILKTLPSSTPPRTLCIGIPKSGTNLLCSLMKSISCKESIRGLHSGLCSNSYVNKIGDVFDQSGNLKNFGNQTPIVDMRVSLCENEILEFYINEFLHSVKSNHFLMSHIQYNEILVKCLKENHFKVIVIFREPKALALSMEAWNRKNGLKKFFSSMSREEALSYVFSGLSKDTREGSLGIVPLKWIYKLYSEWVFKYGALPIFFEDLIGEKGGGTSERQISTIKCILTYLEKEMLSDEELKKIGGDIYGGTHTFRLGQASIEENLKLAFKTEKIQKDIKEINEILSLIREVQRMRGWPVFQ